MRRRRFLGLSGAALSALAFGASAQSMRRIGILVPSQSQWQPATFRNALAEAGYQDGINVQFIVASADNRIDRMRQLAADLVAQQPDVIVAVNTPGTRAAMEATGRIPIVSAIVADPVGLGFVKNLARPEANVTGVANMAADITSKRISLLKEAAPEARRFALYMHPDEPIVAPQISDVERSAAALQIEFRSFPMRTMEDLQRAFDLAADWKANAIVRLAGQAFTLGPATGRMATERGLPSMMTQRQDVEAGALMSYFADHRVLWQRVAAYVDRILKGAVPAELPFEQPTRFELFINLKAASSIPINISPSLLARADELIE